MEIVNNPQSQNLAKEFLDEEYRRAWAEDYLNTTLAQQIAALRRARNWKQSDLAAKAGTTQSAVSRMEDVEYGAHSIRVLKQLAAAFGLRLKVSFEEFGTLIEESVGFTEAALGRHSFQQDHIIGQLLAAQGLSLPLVEAHANSEAEMSEEPSGPAPGHALPFEDQFAAALNGPLPDRTRFFKKWIMGYGLPVPEAPSYKTLYFALPTDHRHGEWSSRLAEACGELLQPEAFAELLSDPDDGEQALTNLLRLSPMLAAGQDRIVAACNTLFQWLPEEWETLPASVQQALIDMTVELDNEQLINKVLDWPSAAVLSTDERLALCGVLLKPEMSSQDRKAAAAILDAVSRQSGKGSDPSTLAFSERVISELSPPEIAEQELKKRPNERVAIAQTLLSR